MKIIALLLLFVFVSFLITPTIVRLIEKDAAISTFYSFSEDEKVQKEIITIVNIDLVSTSQDLSELNSVLILSENLSKKILYPTKYLFPHPNTFNRLWILIF